MKNKKECRYHSGIPTASPMMCDCPKPAISHTPTPWKIKTGDNGFDIIGNDNDIVVEIVNPDTKETVNAVFIVRVVNAHEELVLNLRDIVNAISEGYPKGIPEPLRSMVVRADKAVAKAEGGE